MIKGSYTFPTHFYILFYLKIALLAQVSIKEGVPSRIFEENIQKVLEKNNNSVKLRTTDSRHMQIKEKDNRIEPEIRTLKELSYRNDGNNVDIDVETAKMAKNKIFYDALGQSMSNEIRLLRMAITGRG